MTPSKSKALKEILIFSIPIILGQLGMMLVHTGDMVIAGRYSRECLAAIGLAVSIANPVMISILGFQMAISPMLAKRRGQGESIADQYWTVILYSFFISIVSFVFTYLSAYFVSVFGYGKSMEGIISEYLIITSFSAFGLCLYMGVKEFYQSEEKTFLANLISIIAVGVNLFFCYAFVFGKFGMPELKEAGLAWANLLIRIFMGVALFFLSYKHWKSSKKINWDLMKEVFVLGLPIAFILLLEIMAFCSVTLFVGKFAEIQTAANNLALNLGSLAFMVPLSISAAVAVKVGHAFGEKNLSSVVVYTKTSLLISFIFTVAMGLLFYLFPGFVTSFYTDDVLVLDWAKKLLFWVACFQIFDGAQVTISGVLRGLLNTKASSYAVFFGYWVVGIPLGYYLGFHTNLEAQGFWIGLAVSLAVVACMLGVVLMKKLKALRLQGL